MTSKPKLKKKKKCNLKYIIKVTDRSSFFLIELWRGSKLGVNCYGDTKMPTKMWLSGRNQGI